MSKHSTTTFILKVIAPFKWLIAGEFLVGIIWAIDFSLRPYLLKCIIDLIPTVGQVNAFSILFWPFVFYVGCNAIINLNFRFYDWTLIKLRPPLRQSIGVILMERMLGHSHQLYQNNFAGALSNKIGDVVEGVPNILKIFIDRFFSHTLAILGTIYVLWTVSVKFAWAMLIWVGLFLYIAISLSKAVQKLIRNAAEERSILGGVFVDIISNVMSVRLFSARQAEVQNVKKQFDGLIQKEQQRDWFFLKLFFWQGSSFVVFEAVCIWLLIEGLQQGQVTAGDFALILTLNAFVVNALWSLSDDIRVFSETLGRVKQGLNIVETPISIQDAPFAKSLTAKDLTAQETVIVFENVQFSYDNGNALFSDKSISIRRGEKVGLVGYSGSGKSTFVNLILRLFEVDGGKILIGGQDIRDITQDSLRQHIGMIPQDPSLFHRTLIENIAYGKIGATEAECIEAAKLAYAHEFIVELPQGYNSLVGERGIKLSGGQRQRIAIARAILKNAPILILDEATSQLDSVTEGYIQKSLLEIMEGKTTIVIAHRLSTLLHMDRILVFNDGRIVEDGAHTELLARGGLYKKLWEAQVGGFLPQGPVI